MQKDKFETIQCSRLEVVDSDGNVRLVLNGGRADTSHRTAPQDVVQVLRKDGSTAAKVSIWDDSVFVHIDGGSVSAHSFTASGTFGRAYLGPGEVGVDKTVPYYDPLEYVRKSQEAQIRGDKALAPAPSDLTEEAVRLSCNEHGGTFSVYGKGAGMSFHQGRPFGSGGKTQDVVEIDFDEKTNHGGIRVIHRYPVSYIDEEKSGKERYQERLLESVSGLVITEHGGRFVVMSKHGQSLAALGVDEYGGRVDVFGKDGASQAMLAFDEHGKGTVTTWDKNGYRQ